MDTHFMQEVSKMVHVLKTRGKKFCAVLLCVTLAMGSGLFHLAVVASSGNDGVTELELDPKQFYACIQQTVKAQKSLNPDDRKWRGAYAGEYQNILYGEDGEGENLYEVALPEDFTKKNRKEKVGLHVFVRLGDRINLENDLEGDLETDLDLDNDLEDDLERDSKKDSEKNSNRNSERNSENNFKDLYEFQGDETLMFLFTNQTEVTQRVSLNLGRYSTGIASIGPKSWVKRGADEEWSTGSDAFGSATNSDLDEFEAMELEERKAELGTTSNADGTSNTFSNSDAFATPSNAEHQTLNGEWLEMVLADRRPGRGFVTTAEDLELDQLRALASDSDADFYESETELAVVRAWAEPGTLPDHASLEVTQISGDNGQDGEEYQEYQEYQKYQRAKEALDQQEIAYDGMMAFDIGFLDEQGEEIEPDGIVEVHIELKDGALPEDADPESLAVQHLLENGEEVEVRQMNVEGEPLEFKTDSFSTYTVTFRTEITSIRSISIRDDIANSGTLIPLINGAELTQGGSGRLFLQWYRQTSDGDWEAVERVKVSGDSYNVSDDGRLNVALDIYTRRTEDSDYRNKQYTYRVEAWLEGDENNKKVSPSYTEPYYMQLQNGGFENPSVKTWSQYNKSSFVQLPNGTSGLVWRTTGSDGKIEITGDNPSGAYHFTDYVEGKRAAELNCEAYGSLYQDVLTVPGSELHWQLSHVGREFPSVDEEADTMRVVIMSAPEAIASNITSQSAMETLWAEHPEYFQIADGLTSADITDGPADWKTYSGEYQVPAGQYLTRFFFVAVNAVGGATQGNLIDNVWFSTELPPARPDRGHLTLKKTVVGLDAEDAQNYRVTVTAKKAGSEETLTAELSGFVANGDGSYSATRTFQNVGTGTYEVSETVLETVKDLLSEKYQGPTSTVNGVSGTSTTVEVYDQSETVAEFANTYVIYSAQVTVEKQVTGNMGGKREKFLFRAEVSRAGSPIRQLEFSLQDKDHASSEETRSRMLTELREGDVVTITESGGASGYETIPAVSGNVSDTQILDAGKTIRFVIGSGAGDIRVTFTNNREITSPTGLPEQKLSGLLAMMGLLFGSVWIWSEGGFSAGKRRK